MKYLEWLKTNPEKGYYWVKYQDCDEERIDEFTDWYDNAGNKETKFTEQPDEVISDRLTYIDYLEMIGHCGAYSEENKKLKMKNAKICDTLKKVRDVIQFSSPEEINLEIKCKIIKIIDILVRC